jgi:hypothetical protein
MRYFVATRTAYILAATMNGTPAHAPSIPDLEGLPPLTSPPPASPDAN